MQSSCTTPYLEAESAYVQNMQGLSQMKCGSMSNLSNSHMDKHGGCAKLDNESITPESENEGLSYYLVFLSSFFNIKNIYVYIYIYIYIKCAPGININNGEI